MDLMMFALIGLALFVVIIQIAGSSSRSYFEEKIRNGTVTREDIKKMSHHYSSSGWGNWSTIEKADEVISEQEYKKEIEVCNPNKLKAKSVNYRNYNVSALYSNLNFLYSVKQTSIIYE